MQLPNILTLQCNSVNGNDDINRTTAVSTDQLVLGLQLLECPLLVCVDGITWHEREM
jgi:hypothetical protein